MNLKLTDNEPEKLHENLDIYELQSEFCWLMLMI